MFGMNDPFGNMNSIVNSFFQDPFMNGQGRRNNFDPFAQHNSLMARQQQNMHDPFAMMNQMMGSHMNTFGGGFPNMMNNQPTQAMFSSSSVMTYSNNGDGKPKIYQASSQVRQGPGGVKETRQMLRDSEKGLEKVAVGHHIGNRAHIIERKKENGGEVEEIVNLENLDDEEIPEFNKEFETKLSRSHVNGHGHSHRHHIGGNTPLAIDDKKRDKKSKSKSKH